MTAVRPARPELLAFAAASRGDEWARRLDGAISEAVTAGWPPLVIEAYVLRFLLREDSDPDELRAAVRASRDLAKDATLPKQPPRPGTYDRGLAEARRGLAEAAVARQAKAGQVAETGDVA